MLSAERELTSFLGLRDQAPVPSQRRCVELLPSVPSFPPQTHPDCASLGIGKTEMMILDIQIKYFKKFFLILTILILQRFYKAVFI